MKNITEQRPTDPVSGRTAWVLKFVKPKDIKSKKILDIGCGYGWFELFAIKKGAKEIIGTEVTEGDLQTAKKYIQHKQISFIKGSATDLPIKNNSVDTVVSWEVIEHIPFNTEPVMFSEVNRVLKKGGIFYLSTPHRAFISTLLDPAWWIIGHRHYKREYLENIAKQSGFSVEQCVIRGGWWEVCWLLNLYISKWLFRRKPFYERYFNNKLTLEHIKKVGFTNIYFRFKKDNVL